MTQSNVSEPRFTIRVANQAADEQLIADLFLKFPDQGPRLTEEERYAYSRTETIVIFDANQNLAGTCEMAIVRTPEEQSAQLGVIVLNDEKGEFPRLVLLNICVESLQVEELLRFFTLQAARGLTFMGEPVTGLLRLHREPRKHQLDLRKDGYVLLDVFNHHFTVCLASSLPATAYELALRNAEVRLNEGEIPTHKLLGFWPFRSYLEKPWAPRTLFYVHNEQNPELSNLSKEAMAKLN